MQRHGGSARWYLPHDTCANYHIAEANHWQLCKHIESDPFLDTQGFEAVLEQLHVQAYPQAATRPPRLIAGDLPSIFET